MKIPLAVRLFAVFAVSTATGATAKAAFDPPYGTQAQCNSALGAECPSSEGWHYISTTTVRCCCPDFPSAYYCDLNIDVYDNPGAGEGWYCYEFNFLAMTEEECIYVPPTSITNIEYIPPELRLLESNSGCRK